MPLMSETLTEVAAHVRAQLSPVNHYQNDKKKKTATTTTNLPETQGCGER